MSRLSFTGLRLRGINSGNTKHEGQNRVIFMKEIEDTIRSILKDTGDTLETAEYGLQDLTGDIVERRLPGLRNLVVFGRAVTNVLQRLRGKVQDFDKWYAKYTVEMKSDPLMKYFYNLRSEIIKEGTVKTSWRTQFKDLDLQINSKRVRVNSKSFKSPPNAKNFFVDGVGRSGWDVQLPDGSIEKYYIKLPSNAITISLNFKNPPRSHLGKEIEDSSTKSLSTMYIDYLHKMVDDAKNTFNS